jgi:hypothetical protein
VIGGLRQRPPHEFNDRSAARQRQTPAQRCSVQVGHGFTVRFAGCRTRETRRVAVAAEQAQRAGAGNSCVFSCVGISTARIKSAVRSPPEGSFHAAGAIC